MKRLLPAAIALVLALPAAADAGGWSAHLRYRHEAVADEAFARDAAADTLRLRLGRLHALPHGVSAFVELEAVAELGHRFDSGANGRAAYPAVTDPGGVELNQAWLRWQGDTLQATLGRQRLLLDDQRFVGASGWRQNEQTFDALWLVAEPADGWALRYGWLARVHRVAGDGARAPLARERRLDTHLFNASWQGGHGTLAGYAYLHGDRDLATTSTRTRGLRWSGSRPFGEHAFGWHLEFARQRDHAGNPRHVDARYWRIEPALTRHGVSWKLGWEHLAGDGTTAFQTPLATLHAFNGWADRFATTPASGLDDRYASVNGRTGSGRLAGRLAWTVAWHDFDADRGGAGLGREWNASLAFPVAAGATGLLKFADHRGDRGAGDIRKVWLQFEWAFPVSR